ncbi:hypothetical protein BKP45_15675 [Anaerobacillus alkalidiazotrophicus]|uniref:ABC transporter domain-containing protein n=1 Tax=Anaerobacillus alkalidiazotrophicus TaxID=472963 RepID=A0A1S2M2S4_9BACI|nr:ATP-binding cassette domain-containing protein [Anaerobacillus alkalidiazotrophicus]OIJ18723.1 hypothetical protein BKP45_15675 [Anaerobacillus alkalidiazotrophicus]
MYAIEAKNVSKKYFRGNHKNILFEDMSFHVIEGEIVFISGENKSGKSTLLKMIAAMTPPNRGKIEVLGKDLLFIENRSDWRLKHIGFLTSEDCLIPYLTIQQQLLMGQDDQKSDFEIFTEEANYILSILGIREKQLTQLPDQLSKTEQLKITLARALMTNPRILLLDDFTKFFNSDDRFDIYCTLIQFVKKQNITLIITGETDQCPIADRILKLENKNLVEYVDNNYKALLH